MFTALTRSAYLVIGIAVALAHRYLPAPIAVRPLLLAVACVLLWPLQLLGYGLPIH